MKRLFAYIALFTFIMNSAAAAEEIPTFDKADYIASANSPKTLELGMVDCVAMALKNNSEINVKRISPLIEDANIMIQRAKFEPDVSFNFSMEDNTDLSTSTLYGAKTLKTRTGIFNLGYDQKLVTGTMLSLDFYNTRTYSNSAVQSMNPEFNSEAVFMVTQPLLKGFGILVNKADFLIAKNNKRKSVWDFTQEVIRVITATKGSYYDLQFKQEQHLTAQASFKRAESLHQINRERYAKGLASDVDLLQSEAEMALLEEAVLASEASLKLAEDNLKLVTNLVDDPQLWNANIKLLYMPGCEKQEVDLAGAIQKAFDHRPDYEAAKIDLHSKDISIVYYRNGMLPTVDLIGSYGLNGLDKVYEKDLAHIGGGKYPDWVVGVNVTLPLGSEEEKGRYETAKLQKRQALISFKRLEQRIILEVRDAARKVDINYKIVEATRKSKEAQEKQYAAQLERFKTGLVSTHDIVDFQERLTKAEVSYVKSIIDYNTALIELAKAKGMTLIDDNIKIE